jgi:hypothetical protein
MTAGVIAVAAVVPASASQVGTASVTRPATSAKPAPGPSGSSAQYTAEAPGYGATDSNGFEQATETTTLVRDTGLFSSSYQPFVTLENSTSSTVTPEVELIPTATSSSTPVDSWYPNGDAGSATEATRGSELVHVGNAHRHLWAHQAAGRLDALRADHDQRRDSCGEYRNSSRPAFLRR